MGISLTYEEALYADSYNAVGGVDEAGRGPLAGPVVACAIILPRGLLIGGVNDSKKLSPAKRAALAEIIKEKAVAYGLGIIDAAAIDRVNILQATFLAMHTAVSELSVKPEALLIDGTQAPRLEEGIHAVCLPHGDALSHSVAAASIIAKVTRDLIMDGLHAQYPQYGFNQHKGYGTKAHIQALLAYGPCPEHRRSFKLRALS